MELLTNSINKVVLNNEQEYFDLILSFLDHFPCIEQFEAAFEIEEWDEETHPEEFLNGDIKIETCKFKPTSYPCIYVFCPIAVDDCRVGYNIGGWFDDFLYPNEFPIGNQEDQTILKITGSEETPNSVLAEEE